MIKDKIDLLKKLTENITSKLFLMENEKVKTGISRANRIKPYKHRLTTIEPNCINRNSCKTCLADPKCIWCQKSQNCLVGDSSGSFDGTCSKQGDFSYIKCPRKF